MSVTPQQAMEAVVKLRDKRAELKKLYEADDEVLKDSMERLEAWLLKKLIEAGTDTFKNEAGTAYITETVRGGCADWTLFWKWAADNHRVDMLEKRVSSKAIQDYLEEHKELPPGITITTYRDVTVRRPSK